MIIGRGGIDIIEQIILGLQQEDWLIERESVNWIIARKGQEAIFFTFLSRGKPLSPLNKFFHEDDLIRHREAIIFCPEGLSSYDLNQPMLKKIQCWYIDLQTGSIFSYPPSEKKATLHKVLGFLKQSAPEEESIDSSSEILAPEENEQKSFLDQLKSRPYLTYSLVAINLLLFLLMTLAGGSTQRSVLIQFGAKVNNLILQGEYWRFISSIFIHIGFLHLAFNTYALWALGPIAEDLMGRIRFLIVYLLSGITGSIVSFLFVNALSAGASGAIFGLLGALVSNTRKNPSLWKSGLGKNLLLVIFINLGFGFFQPGIDNYAHMGGLICGYILGRLFP